MARSPGLAAGEVHGPLEVILVLGFGEPAGLACGLAGCSAPRSRAVALVPAVARIRTKKLQAALAFAAIPTSHRVPSCEDAPLARRTASAGSASSLRGEILPPSSAHTGTHPRPPATADSHRWF